MSTGRILKIRLLTCVLTDGCVRIGPLEGEGADAARCAAALLRTARHTGDSEAAALPAEAAGHQRVHLHVNKYYGSGVVYPGGGTKSLGDSRDRDLHATWHRH